MFEWLLENIVSKAWFWGAVVSLGTTALAAVLGKSKLDILRVLDAVIKAIEQADALGENIKPVVQEQIYEAGGKASERLDNRLRALNLLDVAKRTKSASEREAFILSVLAGKDVEL